MIREGDFSKDALAHPARKKYLHMFLEIAQHQREIEKINNEIIQMILTEKRDKVQNPSKGIKESAS
jgi:hypothetical protein